jgi:hypothetical protein
MNLRFPLSDVKVELSSEKKMVKNPLYDDGFFRLNQHEFSMHVEGVGWFFASGGNYVSVVPYPQVSESSLEVYLNGSTYGAILHQRKIMPMHGSCFNYGGLGIMLCGESGAGKSSLTAAFSQKGSHFLTDDVSPMVFPKGSPCILPLSDRIKLWDDSLNQLHLEKGDLAQIWEDYQKFYLPMDASFKEAYPLNLIFIIDKHEKPAVKFKALDGIDCFTALRNEIYRWEYLQGMPESEAQYLKKLLTISAQVQVVQVTRPISIEIDAMRCRLVEFIRNNVLISADEKSK